MVHLYSSIDTIGAWKKQPFILSDRSNQCKYLEMNTINLSVSNILTLQGFLFVLPSRLRLENSPTASLQTSKTPLMSVFDMTLKRSDDEAPVILELCRKRCIPSLPLLLDPH